MDERYLFLIILMCAIVVAVFWISKYLHCWNRRMQQKREAMKLEIMSFSNEKLLRARRQYHDFCYLEGAINMPLFLEILRLLEEECAKRNLN